MANSSPRLSNLTPFTAPDLTEAGVMLNVRVAPHDKEWLKQQEGGMSYHARKALALYRRILSDPHLAKLLEIDDGNDSRSYP